MIYPVNHPIFTSFIIKLYLKKNLKLNKNPVFSLSLLKVYFTNQIPLLLPYNFYSTKLNINKIIIAFKIKNFAEVCGIYIILANQKFFVKFDYIK